MQEWPMKPLLIEKINPFLLSSLPAFLRGSGGMVVDDILFGCGYAASDHGYLTSPGQRPIFPACFGEAPTDTGGKPEI